MQLLGWAEAGDVMETHVSTAALDESAADVGLRMVRQKIGCLPVVDARGALLAASSPRRISCAGRPSTWPPPTRRTDDAASSREVAYVSRAGFTLLP